MFHSTVFVAVTGISVRSSPPSIMNPLCAKSSPGSSSYNSHIFLKFSKSGKQTLFSHFEMDCREMSSFSETSSCDMFFFFRISFNLSPILSAFLSVSGILLHHLSHKEADLLGWPVLDVCRWHTALSLNSGSLGAFGTVTKIVQSHPAKCFAFRQDGSEPFYIT